MQKVYPKTNTYLKSAVQCVEVNLENKRGFINICLKTIIGKITMFKFQTCRFGFITDMPFYCIKMTSKCNMPCSVTLNPVTVCPFYLQHLRRNHNKLYVLF